MEKPKISIPQGTRDFDAPTVRKRHYLLDTIRQVFEIYGFQPLETPALENLETLLGKYGEEGDRLIFKILNNGLAEPSNRDKAISGMNNAMQGINDKWLTERALRYDLTIPFARYVAMNHSQMNFPFRRYQIQPVWRADRPQKNRYREFWQCDADVVGSSSLLNEVDLLHVYSEVWARLGIQAEIRINHRILLTALADRVGMAQQVTSLTVALDKLDKIGREKVLAELGQRGLDEGPLRLIDQYLSIQGSPDEVLQALGTLLGPVAEPGLTDLAFLVAHDPGKSHRALVLDPALARGLNYYTGSIFEVRAQGLSMGSIGGGGRYDNLTGLFGVPDIPGVGISFGVDRIYDLMEELGLFPDQVGGGSRLLFFNLGEKESEAAFALMQTLRSRGIACELYPEAVKMDKQFRYAERKAIPFVAILGSQELAAGSCVLRNLSQGKQETLSQEEFLQQAF
jgi:histidyl-tRNA synthetase